MDVRLLIDQYTSYSLKMLSPFLYELTEDKKMIYFHDEERYILFFIYLNEFLNTVFPSPIEEGKKISLFSLMEQYCNSFHENDDFAKFSHSIKETRDFFFKKRYYKYYISPYDIDFEISFSELINFQSNYSKHSNYHLSQIKDKLKKHFKKNNIPKFGNEDYNEHLAYFKEAVLDDRLNFNQTHMVQQLGELFLSYCDLLNSKHQTRIEEIIKKHIEKKGRLSKWDLKKPDDLNHVEEFFWLIRGRSRFKRKRIENIIPNTWFRLIERETSKENMIVKNR